MAWAVEAGAAAGAGAVRPSGEAAGAAVESVGTTHAYYDDGAPHLL